MEGMVTACVWGELVRWRIRQQQEEFCYLVQNGNIGPHHDGLYCTQMAQTSMVVLRRCLPLWRSKDPQLIKGRWSVDGGIDYFKGDADVNVSIVAQNVLMVKKAGRSFGREKTTVWLSPCPLSPGVSGMCSFEIDSLMRSDQGNFLFFINCKQLILINLMFKCRRHV